MVERGMNGQQEVEESTMIDSFDGRGGNSRDQGAGEGTIESREKFVKVGKK
jgi:hypothetical protein